MSHPADVHPVSLARAAGIDVAMLLFGAGAIVATFFTGQDVGSWQNLVFAPAAFLLAAITLRLALAEVRELRAVMPEAPHKGEAVTALIVAIAMAVIVAPMLIIMPFMFFAAL